MKILLDVEVRRYQLMVFWFNHHTSFRAFRQGPLAESDRTLYFLDAGRLRVALSVRP